MKFFKNHGTKNTDTAISEPQTFPNSVVATPSPRHAATTPQQIAPEPAKKPAPFRVAFTNIATPEAQSLSVQKKMQLLAQKYNDLYAELQDFMFTNRNYLNKQLTAAREQHDSYSQRQAEIDKQLTKGDASSNNEFDRQLAQLSKQHKAANAEQDQHQQNADQFKEQLATLNAQLDELSPSIRELDAKEREIANKMHHETDPLKIVALADRFRSEIDDLHQQQQKLNEQKGTILEQYQQIKTQLDEENTSITELKVRIEHIKDQQISINSRKTTAQKNRATQEKQLQEQKSELAEKQQRNKVQIKELTTQLNQNEYDITKWLGMPYRVKALQLAPDTHIVVNLDSFLPDRADALTTLVNKLHADGIKIVGLYTGYFDINIASEIDSWASQNNINRMRIKIINPLYDVQHSGSTKMSPVSRPQDNVKSSEWNETHTEQTIIMTDDALRLQVQYTDAEASRILAIKYFDGQQITKQSFYNESGILSASVIFAKDGTINREEYYRQNGLTALVVNYENGQQSRLELFDVAGTLVNTFDSAQELGKWWLKHNFAADNTLIVGINSKELLNLIKDSRINIIPFISNETVTSAELNDDLNKLAKQRFIVDDFHTGTTLIKKVATDLEMLTIDEANLPTHIATPLA